MSSDTRVVISGSFVRGSISEITVGASDVTSPSDSDGEEVSKESNAAGMARMIVERGISDAYGRQVCAEWRESGRE